jgi:hypothetical protein
MASGTIEILQGSLGSGKSYVAVDTGIRHLMAGGVLACNFSLVPDWSWKVASLGLASKLVGCRYTKAESLYKRCFKIGSVESFYEVSKKLPSLCEGKIKEQREGKGILIIDEAELFLNTRSYKDNFNAIQFLTQARKLGWKTILIAHSIEMIDKQIRPLITIEWTFRNLNHVSIPFIPFFQFPCNVFIIIRRYCGKGPGSGLKHSSDIWPFTQAIGDIYDSYEVFAFDEVEDKFLHQGLPPEKITEARRYYNARYGKLPGKDYKNRYRGNIKGPYSIFRRKNKGTV